MHTQTLRNFRNAVLNGQTPDARDVALLEAAGVNTFELEWRLLHNSEFRQ